LNCSLWYRKVFKFVAIINYRQPDDVEKVIEEAVVNPDSKENEGGGWWDSLYSAAKSKVFLFFSHYLIIPTKYVFILKITNFSQLKCWNQLNVISVN